MEERAHAPRICLDTDDDRRKGMMNSPYGQWRVAPARLRRDKQQGREQVDEGEYNS